MGEWKVQVSVRVTPALRTEPERCATAEKRSLANFGVVLLEWAFEQFKFAGTTQRLLKCPLKPLTTKPGSWRRIPLRGWLPPSNAAAHPAEGPVRQQLLPVLDSVLSRK
jgi:hypothetical protein